MPAEARGPVVFVVDDEPNIARTAALILCREGFDARGFTEPLTALEAARSDAPNLLLSDVIMPKLNGYELVSKILENCPDCKALLFTGNPSARDNFAGTAAERDLEILLKPVQPLDLLDVVRRKLDS